MSDDIIEPVRHTVTVPLPVERAFSVFTDGFDKWWPRSHRIGATEIAEAVLEPRAGGRWYERSADGSECDWGRVLVFEPPHRLVVTWHINGQWQYDPDPGHASEVEVRFTEDAGHTRVDLEHRHIERHGGSAVQLSEAVASQNGWSVILGGYAKIAADTPSRS
ncbi:SRPBCC family protein [Sphaerimonospora mesophila]|uniref:SRPBCC family protein n=1 Tax=Sphaerimonospora mesophila TaxID=37483 RepID=UPI0006E21A8D